MFCGTGVQVMSLGSRLHLCLLFCFTLYNVVSLQPEESSLSMHNEVLCPHSQGPNTESPRSIPDECWRLWWCQVYTKGPREGTFLILFRLFQAFGVANVSQEPATKRFGVTAPFMNWFSLESPHLFLIPWVHQWPPTEGVFLITTPTIPKETLLSVLVFVMYFSLITLH